MITPPLGMSALSHSRPSQLAPKSSNVRYASNSDKMVRRGERSDVPKADFAQRLSPRSINRAGLGIASIFGRSTLAEFRSARD